MSDGGDAEDALANRTEQPACNARRRPTYRADMTLSAHNPNNCGIFHYVGGPKGDGRTPKTEKHLRNNTNTAATAANAARSTVWRQRMKKMLEK